MARGNQREKAREKNLKDQAGQGKKNTMTGAEQQKNKEDVARIMREKQEAANKKKAEAAAGGKSK